MVTFVATSPLPKVVAGVNPALLHLIQKWSHGESNILRILPLTSEPRCPKTAGIKGYSDFGEQLASCPNEAKRCQQRGENGDGPRLTKEELWAHSSSPLKKASFWA